MPHSVAKYLCMRVCLFSLRCPEKGVSCQGSFDAPFGFFSPPVITKFIGKSGYENGKKVAANRYYNGQ